MLKPVINELIKEGYDIETIDIDEGGMAVAAKGIMSVPTLILYDQGVEVGRASGAPSKSEIKEWLDE
jgi:thioredoxin-like negative regulator of GroEL